MEFWKSIIGLQGKVLNTLDQGKPFDISHVSSTRVNIIPHKSKIERTIYMKEIEGSYRKLKAIGRITRVEIEAEFSPRNPAYIAAILSTLPGVRYHCKPIITLNM